MNNPSVARNQGEASRRSSHEVHDVSRAASARHRRSRWQITTFARSVFALVAVTGALMLIGCPGSDDDSADSETFEAGFRARDFRNVLPLVNGRDIAFPNGVMGAGGTGDPATLRVTGFEGCDEAMCGGSFVLTDSAGEDGEGDSGGDASCFFNFNVVDTQAQPRGTINCLTCDLEVVDECEVEEGEQTQCEVRWLLAGAADAAPEDAFTSDVFEVTLENVDGDIFAILAGGQRVLLVDEDDE